MLETLQDTWCNQDNRPFYEKMPIQELVEHAISSGVSDGEDIDQIKDLIMRSASILDVGCGYGRVLKHILGYGYEGKLDTVEMNSKYFEFASSLYSEKVGFYHGDILTWQTENKYDLIMWLWGSVTEFIFDEQQEIISKLSGLLNKGGALVVDKRDPKLSDFDILKQENEYYYFIGPTGKERLYIPSDKKLREYGVGLFERVKKIPYNVNNNVERTFFIYS